ncbi:MAG: hypothetical protein Fur0018_19540 [Anaerolineales bacterium]
MAYKFGRFLLVIGVMLVVLFILTDTAGRPWLSLFLIGGPLVALGGFLMHRFATPSKPSGRFAMFQKKGKSPEK